MSPEEAQIIVQHWNDQKESGSANFDQDKTTIAKEKLQNLCERLNRAVVYEKSKSPVGKAFVKLSTRSPKDSRIILRRAKVAYEQRLRELSAKSSLVDSNVKWRVLSDEVATASAVSDGSAALEMMLDSSRIFEDLQYALEGFTGDDAPRQWNIQLVARAWEPRVLAHTEFRGICWNGKLTCVGQYFHPLYFPDVVKNRNEIEVDILACMDRAEVRSAVMKLGGTCIIDFARIGPGETLIVEMNPFDGESLGTLPASTGLFLWDNPEDRDIIMGRTPFAFRVREQPMEEHKLKADFHSDWKAIIYGHT